jgi:hypothetical protein
MKMIYERRCSLYCGVKAGDEPCVGCSAGCTESLTAPQCSTGINIQLFLCSRTAMQCNYLLNKRRVCSSWAKSGSVRTIGQPGPVGESAPSSAAAARSAIKTELI